MHDPCSNDASGRQRLALGVRGVVQGVGFRPFVYSLARAAGLVGWVRNEAAAVRIEIEGAEAGVQRFVAALQMDLPPSARIDELTMDRLPPRVDPAEVFRILPSSEAAAPRPTIPADLATCPACAEEIRAPEARRYRYPFTNCTHCGPRWSIIAQVPYDRERTSMAGFAMCAACRAEYEDPADRRFHAQPIACPQCGPRLSLLDPGGRPLAEGDAALGETVRRLQSGAIVALRGLGGFQLVVDATNEAAVVRLRQRKRRPDRPFALLMPSLAAAAQVCRVSADEAQALTSPPAPILLLRRRDSAATGAAAAPPSLAAAVAPGNPYLGVMLPYTPLHQLLSAGVGRPLVCTSGNLAEEPMAIETEEALGRLGAIADLFLAHDRPIVRPVDDSVARFGPTGLQVLRRARGYAPLPLDLGFEAPPILALGGHLKNTVALNLGAQVVISAHVGDLDSVASVAVFRRAIDDLLAFFQVRPAAVVCDLHPDYASTREAEQRAAALGVPLLRVQHHHAHAAAGMAEHRLAGATLALAWDGTGYGGDGTIWGGEALLCEGPRFRRAAHLRTFPLPGGDRAAREPRRAALGLLYELLGDDAVAYAREWFTASELRTLRSMLAEPRHCPRTSSMGRLFDAVAAICGLGLRSSFEGQAAMALEFAAVEDEQMGDGPDLREAKMGLSPLAAEVAASGGGAAGAYPLPLAARTDAGQPTTLDWGPLVQAVLADRQRGASVGRISRRFHAALAAAAVQVAQQAAAPQVVLGGGCFQNLLLTEYVGKGLRAAGFRVECSEVVPPGDGGIALGQLWLAARQIVGDV